MTLKIETSVDEYGAVMKLIGRIQGEELSYLKSQIPAGVPRLALALGEVSVVDFEAIQFLNTCESEGVQLVNCPAYIRKWIDKEKEAAPKRS